MSMELFVTDSSSFDAAKAMSLAKKPLGRLLLVVVVLLVCTGARRPKPMYMPKPMPVPSGVSMADATKAAREAVVGKGWVVESLEESDTENTLIAKLLIRVHMVTIKVRVTGEQVSIEYVASTEMGYMIKDSKPYIHPKYTEWVHNIEINLQELLLNLAP